jgi:hypothetical protein
MVLEEGVESRAGVENREVIENTMPTIRMILPTDGFIVQKTRTG